MSQTQSVTAALLDSYVGKNIADICPNGFEDNKDFHCAHFVSHVLGLEFGATCRQQVVQSLREAPGANIRVAEVFAHCPEVQELVECPTTGAVLIFVSAPGNFSGQPVTLSNVGKKHIGILFNGTVWHYDNALDRVIPQVVAKFSEHYRNQTNALWIGSFPRGAKPRLFKELGIGVWAGLNPRSGVISGPASPDWACSVGVGGAFVGPCNSPGGVRPDHWTA